VQHERKIVTVLFLCTNTKTTKTVKGFDNTFLVTVYTVLIFNSALPMATNQLPTCGEWSVTVSYSCVQ
jgi:hypothetical protein